jgi:hypothetical protein
MRAMMTLYVIFEGGGFAVPLETSMRSVNARLERMRTALAEASSLMGIRGGLAWTASVRGSRMVVRLSGAPKARLWTFRWAAWTAAAVLAEADPRLGAARIFAGVTGLGGLSLPAGEIHASGFPDSIDAALGMPHEGLRRGVRTLLESREFLPAQVTAGWRAPLKGIPEGLLLSQFSREVFLDPWTAAVERLEGDPLRVRVSTRPLPPGPDILQAYAAAVRSLFYCSLS